MKFLLFLIVALLAGSLVFYGCNGVDKNTQQQVTTGAQNTLEASKKAAIRIGGEIQQSAVQSEETFKVKGPIDASKDIDSSHISVTTIGKKVVIDGSIPSQDQKDKVQKMADANKDSGYTIENNLKIEPAATDGKPATDKWSASNPPITDDQTK